SPRFILTSATIANPTGLAERLVEAPVALVDNDGSARGPRHFLIYNPPLVDPDLGLRRSAVQESIHLADDLLAYQVQTIIFGRSRPQPSSAAPGTTRPRIAPPPRRRAAGAALRPPAHAAHPARVAPPPGSAPEKGPIHVPRRPARSDRRASSRVGNMDRKVTF